MTLNDIVKRIKDRTYKGSTSVTTDEVTAQIIRAINDCRRKIVRQLPKEYFRKTGTLSIVQGTTTYSLASDVLEPLLFWFETGGALYHLTKVPTEKEFRQLVYDPNSSQNNPEFYFDAGRDSSGYRQIVLFPTPSGALTVNYTYYKDPTRTELTTSDLATEFPDIPSSLQDVVTHGAMWLFLKCFDDVSAQDRAKMEFDRALIEMDIAEEMDLDDLPALRYSGAMTNPDVNNTRFL